jgi:hypothetical protein
LTAAFIIPEERRTFSASISFSRAMGLKGLV